MARKTRLAATETQDLLIELGCEDLPARYVQPLAAALAAAVSDGLSARGIAAGPRQVFATPRRLAVRVEAIAPVQADQRIERSGPALAAALRDGQPTAAGLGFAKSCGVEFAALGQKDGKLQFSKTVAGRRTAELLPEIFAEALKRMDELVPKRMRWGDGEETFVRPVQWIVAMLGGKVVPISRFGLKSGNRTYGHRFHAPKAFALKSPAEYEKKLRAAKVWADFATRRAEVWQRIEAEARKLKGQVRPNESLLDEVTALVEWPVAVHGRMEPRFMTLPQEVIIATIEHNQRYFPVFDTKGSLLPAFITVSNIESRDATQVVLGNERVVRPRLSDALFFWEQDRRKSLALHAEALEKTTFQQKLGTLADKSRRIVDISSKIAGELHIDIKGIQRAARLCKADLVTRMVFEFPELQGIMGGHYAKSSGETGEVADAIREHYLPTQAGGPIPQTAAGRVVALADKLDSLAGIFAIGQKPAASKDPFALRRAALGVLRILIEGRLALDLKPLLRFALERQPVGQRDEATLAELLEFVLDRLPSYYEELPAEMFAAVKALGVTTPLDFDARLQALRDFRALPEAANLAAAHKRVRNILRQAGETGTDEANAALFVHQAEQALAAKLDALVLMNGAADYAEQLKNLAALRAPVDAFFDQVVVNAEDAALRANRLALLRRLDRLCREVADLSCLPG